MYGQNVDLQPSGGGGGGSYDSSDPPPLATGLESDFRHWTHQHLLSDNELLNVSGTSRFNVLQNPGAVTVCVLQFSW